MTFRLRRPVLPRRGLASLAGWMLLGAQGAAAQAGWRPGRNVEIVVGTNPGTGFDRTARVLQSVWQEQHVIDAPVTVLNKPGGAGVIGFRFVDQRARFADEMSVIGPLLLTNFITHTVTFSPRDLTPLCILLGEEIVIAVRKDSPIRSGADFADILKRDPASLAIALSGIGGQNHVTVGLVGQAVGADISKLKIVGFEGSGEAVTAALGGHVDAVIAPPSSLGGMIESGQMRGLGIASEQRQPGVMASVPTWREQGIDVVFTNWRGIAGPIAMTPAQVAYWDQVFGKTVSLRAWQEELARSGLSQRYLDSGETRIFLAAEEQRLEPVLRNLGFVR